MSQIILSNGNLVVFGSNDLGILSDCKKGTSDRHFHHAKAI